MIQLVDLFLIQYDVQLLLHSAGGGDPGNTGDAFQLVHQLFAQKFRQLHRVHAVHGDRRNGNGQHGGVDLQHIGRPHHLIPGGGKAGKALLNIHADGIQIHILLKFQHHHAVILRGGGGDLYNMLQGGHGLLQRAGQLLLHLFRACAGIGGHDHNVGEIHIGKQIRGHIQVRYHTQNQHRDHRHKHRQRLFNTKL